MTWLRDTIAGRTIIVLVLGLGSIMALAQYLYQTTVEREVTASNTTSIVGRLMFMADQITLLEPEKRDDAAHRMSGGPLEIHWGREPLATPGGSLDEVATGLRDRLIAQSPGLAERGLIIGTSRPNSTSDAHSHAPGHQTSHETSKTGLDDDHITLVSLPLTDGSWLNVTLARVRAARASTPSALLSLALGAVGLVLVSILMSRWLTQPLERLAAGARQLFLTSQNVHLPETGTREVRTLASAINDLQQRIRRLVDDRTQMLAAISHDLRTPLTRLRLRVESIADADVRNSIAADLDEMEQMIDATLDFLRGDTASEAVERVDLAAILHTIADDSADAGDKVHIAIPRNLVIEGRHLALKRAFTNLVQNACKYGQAATVSAAIDGAAIAISITDDGPGIPNDKLDAVFEPFYRVEQSRGRKTGGHGLGLTVARSILRAHGGDVVLVNRSPRGLEARIHLPIAPRLVSPQ